MKLKRTKKRGALFIEVLLGIFVLSMGAAAMFSLFPTLTRAERISREESIAGQLSNRYLEHIQLLRPTELTRTNLSQLGLIDEGETELPYAFTHVPLDEASGYSPARMLRNGAGELDIDVLEDGSKLVTVTISWKSSSGISRSFRSGTVLGAYR